MRSKTQSNHDLRACIFPRLEPLTFGASSSDWFFALFTSVLIGQRNRPFPSCCAPHYESEGKCKVFIMKM